jgi:hypothetical protein
MGRLGLTVVPIELIEAYCERANVTNHADGTLRHYHVVISNEQEPHMVPSQGNPRYPLREYFERFERGAHGSSRPGAARQAASLGLSEGRGETARYQI